MNRTNSKLKDLLKANSLRVTNTRLAVLDILSSASKPLSHSEVLVLLASQNIDPATIYRNLIKLREVNILQVASKVNGVDRYVLQGSLNDIHQHPHFSCEDCKSVICLPESITSFQSIDENWTESINKARILYQGKCPDCIQEI
jgi:Fur family transcriptional regulator, ferric uptake regulator